MIADLRHGLRVLWRTPRFSLLAIAVLALGVAANATVFSLVSAVLFRPLPVHEPERLRFLFLTDPAVPNFQGSVAYRDYLTLRERNFAFSGLTARITDIGQLKLLNDVVQVRGEAVAGDYFDVLGVQAALGRTFEPDAETGPASPLTIVLSHRLWRNRFNGDSAILGSAVLLDGAAYTVIGIVGPGFTGTISSWEPADYWTPLIPRVLNRRCASPNFTDGIGVSVIGRLKPGATDADARQMVSADDLRFRPASLPANARPSTAMWRVDISEWAQHRVPFDLTGRIVPSKLAAALMGVAALVLLVGIANLTGLVMARAVSRRSEIAIRLTLGATPGRLSRQLIAEGVLLALAGALLTLLVMPWLLHVIAGSLPHQVSTGVLGYPVTVVIQPAVDLRVGLFLLAVSLIAGVVIGIAPLRQALRSTYLAHMAAEEAIGTSPVRARFQHWNMLPQVCIALVLLMIASVLVREAVSYDMIDPGYDPQGLVFAQFSVPPPCREEPADRRSAWTKGRDRLHERLLQQTRVLNDFSSVDLTSVLPFVSNRAGRTMVLARPEDGSSTPEHRYQSVSRTSVTRGYFRTMGIPLVAGRDFRKDDAEKPSRVAIVCSGLARRLWGGRTPVGQALAFHEPSSSLPPRWLEVVGVVKEVKAPGALGDNPIVYTPLGPGDWAMAVVARTTAPTAAALGMLRHTLSELDPRMQLWRSTTMHGAADEMRYPQRLAASVMSTAGLLALFLASVGLYGTISYSVAQRTREIGIRTALGAARGDIVGLFVRDGATILGVASMLGLALGYIVIGSVSKLLAPLPPFDAVAALTVIAVVATVVLLACYFPARRAARVDPTTALRAL